MSVIIELPDTVADAIQLPEDELGPELKKELAVALYARGLLSFGKARELSELSHYEFGKMLGDRGIARQYGREELEEDISYARGQ